MISVNFTNFSILNKSALATVIATFLFLISFGLFSIATAEAGTLPGYDVYNSKMNTPSISLNYSEVARATNNISVLLSGQTAPFTAFSYKINDTIIDMPPKPLYKAYGFVLPTDKVRGFKVGENEIFLRLCSAEGCGDWSQPAILKITSYVADSACPADATQGVCGTFIKSTQSKIVDGKVYPYHYTLLNDPLNSKIRKPNIVSTSVPDSINIGSSLNKFWDWVISDNDLVDRYQIKVNNRITEENTLTIWNVTKANGVYEFNGYKVGDNNVSVRFCNYEGCGPWSNSITVKVTDSLLNKNCWLQLVEPSGKITVKAKSTGTIFRTSSGLFSTDSDLGVVATYLGAPVGSIVELAFNNINTSADKCGNNYPKTTKNGITTTEYLNQPAYKLNMQVGMTVLCTGNDCAYSGQDYSHVPSASTNTNTTTNTTNTGTTNTTNTTNSTILPTPVASQCLGDPAPASQTVTATAFGGGVYGSGPFTTGSDLSRIATYLGASVGSKASLTIVDAGCLNNYRSVTNNGVTTVPWYSTWRGMVVTCTSGCGTGTTVGTNTGNTTVGSGNTLGISGDLSKMSYSELLNVLKTLTDYLNNLVSSSGGTGVGVNNTTGTVTPTPATGTCLGTPAPASQTVTANNSPFKFVYGTGPFTTGSDLGKIAAYLGAPVGSEAKLQITDIGCIQNYNYTVQNGVTSIGWPAAWHGMTVICTSGCTSNGSVGNDTSGDGSSSSNNSNSVEINNNISAYNEPLNTKFPKPKINGSGGNKTQDVYFGQAISLFWAWSIPLSISYDSYQIKVNSTITEYDANSPAFSSKVTNLYVNDIIGFRVADDNKLSVRVCDVNGCSQWSDPMTIDVWLGWTKNMCSSSPIGLSIKVRVNNEGVIYGSGTSNSPFTTDSDLGTIAAFMGNKIGDVVTMNTDYNSMCMSTNDDTKVTKNGITTTPYNVNVKDQKRTMLVKCVEGCSN